MDGSVLIMLNSRHLSRKIGKVGGNLHVCYLHSKLKLKYMCLHTTMCSKSLLWNVNDDSLLVEWGKGLNNHYCRRIDNVTLK